MDTRKGHEYEWRYHVRLIQADADGVAPSLLLSAPNNGPQYLFNVPDGFSRLVLEHKLRPSGRLASVFLTSLRPHCAGGLGGLLLRLAGDGHGQVQLIGPDCTSAYLHALRHVIYWRHPKVFICDCQPFRPSPVFDDDFVTICPILPNGKILACPWCENEKNRYKENELHKNFSAGASSKSRFECKSFDGLICSSGDDEMDSHTSSSLEGSVSSGSEIDKSIPTRHMIQNDCYQNNSKLLYKGIKTYEGKRIQVKEECQAMEFGSNTSECCSGLNDNVAKRDSLGHLLAATIEHNYEGKEECPIVGGAMEDSKELFNEKEFKAYNGIKNSSVMGENFSTCKRKRGSLMSDLKKCSFLDLEARNKLVSEVLQCSTYPSIQSCLKCCSKDITNLVSDPTLQMQTVTHNSGVHEPYCMDCLQEQRSELLGARDSVVSLIGIHDIPMRKDLTQGGLFTVQENVHLLNQRKILAKLRDEEKTGILLSGGQESEFYWRVNNSIEIELPDLPDGAIPLYVKSPAHGVTVMSKESMEQNQLAGDRVEDDKSSVKAREIIGYVCYMKKLGSAFIVVNCDTPESADELLQNSLLSCVSCCNAYENDQNRCLHSICAVFHLSPPSVLRTEKYMRWMRHFGDDILHMVMQGGSAEYGFLYSFSSLAKMNLVDKEIFPLPFKASLCNQHEDTENIEDFRFSGQVKIGRLLMSVAFQGILGRKVQVVVDDSMCQETTNVELIQQYFTQSRPDLAEKTKKFAEDIIISSQDAGMQMSANKMAALALREKLLLQRKLAVKDSTIQGVSVLSSNISVANNSNHLGAENISRSLYDGRSKSAEFRLLFLGTGSAEPMKQRGSSGILLEVHDRGCMLLDAGEGVAGQILRAFGKHKMKKVVDDLQCVWISHKHADHVLGVISIIAARSENGPTIVIVGSTQVREWLQEVNCIYGRLGYSFPSFTFVQCQELMTSQQRSSLSKRLGCEDPVSRMLENLQLCSMRCVWVDHCFQACGLVLSSLSGWSIVYSGDTRPCKALIEAGMGCTLLIHEATFEDNFVSHARAKRHSTISEALEVGQQMGAKHVILTHFSQRSPKIMRIGIPENQNVSFAYDGMVACNYLLHALPALMQCLVSLFDDYNGTMSCQDSNAAIVNQSKQFNGASDKKLSELLEVRFAPTSNESMTNKTPRHTAATFPSMKLPSSEECHLPKHIRWNDLESKGTPSHTAVVIPSMNLKSSEQGTLPKHIRWIDSESEDD
ncbi:hypothetical protein KI387_015145 [Taxus chinensis]|uniref:ribonuclease Z n=1 Tax=Taxus chinensis TaxID=29808 RepID=A0AA38GBM4_TAXCH|nr:hypothetical protein KI387_015145 [Taxus chinensis]